MAEVELPTYEDLMPSVLDALAAAAAAAGGSLARNELMQRALDHADLSDDQLGVTYGPGSRREGTSVVMSRVGFAISSLKMCGATDNSQRGVWTVTAHGRELLDAGRDAMVRENRSVRLEARLKREQYKV